MIFVPPARQQAQLHQQFKRLIRSSDYRRIYRQGCRLAGAYLRFYYAPNPTKYFRLGVTVSKRISKKATERNWYKRVIKEWFWQHAFFVPKSFGDIVIVVNKAVCVTPQGSAKLRKELAQLNQQMVRKNPL